MSAEENNIIVKTMMLQQNCNHVTGDDTNEKGFKLIVDDPDDKECDCQLVRSIGGGINTRCKILDNTLRVDAAGNTPLRGGGRVTARISVTSLRSVIRRAVFLSYSEPVVLSDANNNIVSVPFVRDGERILWYVRDNGFAYIEVRGAISLEPNDSLFLLDSLLSIDLPEQRFNLDDDRPIGVVNTTTRFVRVPQRTLHLWSNQRFHIGIVYLLARFEGTPGNENFFWVPNCIDFPANQVLQGEEQFRDFILTYDTTRDIRSWLQSEVSPLQRFINNPFDITHTLSGGGIATYSRVNQFAFIRWFREHPIRISHIPFSIRRIGSISLEMPTGGTRIRVINRDGTIGSSEVRDLGIEMATNEKSFIFHFA
jgi:hypothetical protein